MTRPASPAAGPGAAAQDKQDWTLVWVDAREAVFAGWHDGEVDVERVESEVPRHHRATGHVRHSTTGRTHAGPPRSAGETHRLEHLRRFIEQVAGRLSPTDALAICGPGTVAVQLAHLLRDADGRHGRARPVIHRRSARLTEAQLIAELRQLAGDEPPRRTVGAHRWSGLQPATSAGIPRPPRRVVRKPPVVVDDGYDEVEQQELEGSR